MNFKCMCVFFLWGFLFFPTCLNPKKKKKWRMFGKAFEQPNSFFCIWTAQIFHRFHGNYNEIYREKKKPKTVNDFEEYLLLFQIVYLQLIKLCHWSKNQFLTIKWTIYLNLFFLNFSLFSFSFYLKIVAHEPHYASYGHYDYDTYDNHYAYEPHAHGYSHY